MPRYRLGNRGLVYVYLIGWLLCWGLHAIFTAWVDTYPPHTEPWILEWLMTSFENLASEYHQVGAFVLLAKFFVFKDSPQSRDGDDGMKADIKAIRRQLEAH